MRHHILSNSKGIIKVYDSMPPTSRHKDSFAWVLNKLNELDLFMVFVLSDFRQNFSKVVDRLIDVIFAPVLFTFHNWFG